MTMSATQYRAMLDAQRELVEAGVHPSIAGSMVRRAANRLFEMIGNGMGKIQPTRRLARDLVPGLAPRPVVSGGQCVMVQEQPGNEEQMYIDINRYESQGWNVMEVEASQGYPRLRRFYACPPGQLPGESQSQVLQSEAWGPPLYV